MKYHVVPKQPRFIRNRRHVEDQPLFSLFVFIQFFVVNQWRWVPAGLLSQGSSTTQLPWAAKNLYTVAAEVTPTTLRPRKSVRPHAAESLVLSFSLFFKLKVFIMPYFYLIIYSSLFTLSWLGSTCERLHMGWCDWLSGACGGIAFSYYKTTRGK